MKYSRLIVQNEPGALSTSSTSTASDPTPEFSALGAFLPVPYHSYHLFAAPPRVPPPRPYQLCHCNSVMRSQDFPCIEFEFANPGKLAHEPFHTS